MAVDKGLAGECQAARGAIPANVEKRMECVFSGLMRGRTRHDLSLRTIAEPPKRRPRQGRLAQLVERFVYTEDVGGSSLVIAHHSHNVYGPETWVTVFT